MEDKAWRTDEGPKRERRVFGLLLRELRRKMRGPGRGMRGCAEQAPMVTPGASKPETWSDWVLFKVLCMLLPPYLHSFEQSAPVFSLNRGPVTCPPHKVEGHMHHTAWLHNCALNCPSL